MNINNIEHGRTCVYSIGYHFAWSTKYRREVLQGSVEVFLKELFHNIAIEYKFDIVALEVMPDHCHLFMRAHPKHSPSVIAKLLKGISARKLFQEFPKLKKQLWRGHLWNPSYYVGTAGSLSENVIKKYIEEQKKK